MNETRVEDQPQAGSKPSWIESRRQSSEARGLQIEQHRNATKKTESFSVRESKPPFTHARWRMGLAALTGTSLLASALFSACGGEQEGQVTVTPLIPTSTAVHEIIQDGLPSTKTPIVETPTSQSPTQSVPTETVPTPEVQSVFNSLREKITSLESTEQQELRAIIDKIETTDTVLEEINSAYETTVEPDGTPTLIALKKRTFQNLDFSPVLEAGGFINIEDYLKETDPDLFFVRDRTTLEGYKNQLASMIQSGVSPEEIAQSLNQMNADFFETLGRKIYLNTGTQQTGFVNVEVDPSLAGILSQFRTHQQEQQLISQVTGKLPIPGEIKMVIIGGQVARTEKTGPQEMTIYLGRDIATDFIFQKKAAHELGVLLQDPEFLLQKLSPKQIVELLIAREKLLLDPTVGLTFPDLVFTQEANAAALMPQFTEPVTKEVFRARISIIANSIGLAQTAEEKSGLYGPLEDFVFSQYLPTAPLEEIAARTPDTSVKIGTLAEIFEANPQIIDAIAQINPYWAKAIELLKQDPHQFDQSAWASIEGLPLQNKNPAQFVKESLPIYANFIFLEGMLENDPNVTGLFSETEKAEAIKLISMLSSQVETEHAAEAIAYYTLTDHQYLQEGVEPIGNLISIATAR